MSSLQEKGSEEIVFKAMGRAINKTVTIVELIKVLFAPYGHSDAKYFVILTLYVYVCREELLVCTRSHQLDPLVSPTLGSH